MNFGTMAQLFVLEILVKQERGFIGRCRTLKRQCSNDDRELPAGECAERVAQSLDASPLIKIESILFQPQDALHRKLRAQGNHEIIKEMFARSREHRPLFWFNLHHLFLYHLNALPREPLQRPREALSCAVRQHEMEKHTRIHVER